MNVPLWFANLVSWSAQVALLLLAARLLLRLLKIRQPHVILNSCRCLLLVVVALPLLQPWHRLPTVAPLAPVTDVGTIQFSTAPAATHWHFPSLSVVLEWTGIAILGGIAVKLILLAVGLVKLRRLREASEPIENNEPAVAIIDQMFVRVGAMAEFRISANVDSPVSFGAINPIVLLPSGFVTTDARLQSVVVCHELVHTRRRDWSQHVVEEIVRAVFWFHPSILWLISRIRLSREQLVDLEVVRLTDARQTYVDALLEFTRRPARPAALPAPPFLTEHQLVERISLILKEVHMSRRKLIASLAVISCTLVVVLGLSARSFPLKLAPHQAVSATNEDLIAGAVSGGVAEGVSGGVASGTTGGVVGGIVKGVVGGVLGARSSSDIPQIDAASIWIDTVKKGPMVRQVRGLGKLVPGTGSTTLIARANVPAFLTADVKPGQSASVDTKKGHVANGHVIGIEPNASGDTRTIDVALDTKPDGAEANLEVDVTVDIERIENTLQVGRPIHGAANKEVSLFKIDDNGTDATRVSVKFGRASVASIEVLAGLKEGDRIILSDMSQVGTAEHVHITGQSPTP
jgi:beta-lactamase regulating signal transducer with metallopeptidase domain